MAGRRQADCFVNEQWIKIEDVFWAALSDGQTSEEGFLAAGYGRWFQAGDPSALVLPLTLTVYSRPKDTDPTPKDPPRFVVVVESHDDMEWAYAQELRDVMALLGQWMPTIHSVAVTDVVRQLNDLHSENRDVVELLTQLTNKR